MHRQRLRTRAILLALSLVLITGCSGDCGWDANFRTWIDENENGVWDADESPLPDVKIVIESSVLQVPELISDEKGEARLHEALAGCPDEAAFFVYVLPPPGYRPTIRTLYPAAPEAERRFEFGFVVDD